jgi:hypothetical protein
MNGFLSRCVFKSQTVEEGFGHVSFGLETELTQGSQSIRKSRALPGWGCLIKLIHRTDFIRLPRP